MLVLVHDPTSLASACAWLRCQRVSDAGGRVAFEGFDQSGFDVTLPVSAPQQAEYLAHVETAHALGLPARPPTCNPPTARCCVVEVLADEAGLGGAWRAAVHHAFWVDGRDLNDVGVLTALATSSGLDADRVAAALADGRALATVRRRMRQRRAGGVGGAPVLVLDGTLLSPDIPDDALHELAALP